VANQEYVFNETRERSELERLKAIEAVFDPPTKSRLVRTGLSKGFECLEVGPGAGSIMYWLGERVGSEGRVVGVEMNPRFLQVQDLPNIEILSGDIREVEFDGRRFDLIHIRYVLLHISNYQFVLEKLLSILKPGGWVVLEEPDFSAARPISGPQEARHSFEKVNRAICQMYQKLGIDYSIGLKLPHALRSLGIEDVRIENDTAPARGGSGIARMMRMSAEQLREKYIATGAATNKDVDAYCEFSENPETQAIYYSTVAIMAQSRNKVPPVQV
jgi:SAM-dependent methyltransferase